MFDRDEDGKKNSITVIDMNKLLLPEVNDSREKTHTRSWKKWSKINS